MVIANNSPFLEGIKMSEIKNHCQLAMNTLKNGLVTMKFHSRFDAQIAVNNKRVFGEINLEEWSRLTDILSGSCPSVDEVSGCKSSQSRELCLANER